MGEPPPIRQGSLPHVPGEAYGGRDQIRGLVQSADPPRFEAVAAGYEATAEVLYRAFMDLSSYATKLVAEDTWGGESAREALGRMERIQRYVESLHDAVGVIPAAIRPAAQALASTKASFEGATEPEYIDGDYGSGQVLVGPNGDQKAQKIMGELNGSLGRAHDALPPTLPWDSALAAAGPPAVQPPPGGDAQPRPPGGTTGHAVQSAVHTTPSPGPHSSNIPGGLAATGSPSQGPDPGGTGAQGPAFPPVGGEAGQDGPAGKDDGKTGLAGTQPPPGQAPQTKVPEPVPDRPATPPADTVRPPDTRTPVPETRTPVPETRNANTSPKPESGPYGPQTNTTEPGARQEPRVNPAPHGTADVRPGTVPVVGGGPAGGAAGAGHGGGFPFLPMGGAGGAQGGETQHTTGPALPPDDEDFWGRRRDTSPPVIS
ncbi:hypothetical protein [Streptosporangium sp. KLBMP 9127]|nr:hypothetical protein [Streptosporangium sp. KLBMP 9127]